MPTFALSGKYTPEALAAVRKDGFASREAAVKTLVESLGGKLVAFYWPLSAEWDLTAIVELSSSDDAYAIGSMSLSSVMQRGQAIELRSSAEADATIARQLNWKPPGS